MINSKYIAAGIFLIIIFVLIATGPANAFFVDFISGQTVVDKGVIALYNITLVLEDNENLEDIDFLLFRLNKIMGDINNDCKFDINGGVISGCLGIKAEKVLEFDCDLYGYDSRCDTKFDIFVDTTKFDSGEYKTFFIIQSDELVEETKGKNLNIKDIKDLSCSLRAKEGKLLVNGNGYDKTRISFYIPFREARNGGGYLTGQMKRVRFSYKFEVIKVLENNENMARAEINGMYRVGPYDVGSEKAILTFNKNTKEITVIGDKINYKNGEVYFRKGC